MVKKIGKKKKIKKNKRKAGSIKLNKNKVIKDNKEKIDTKNESKEDNICIICLAEYDNQYHLLKKLKCNHTLCESCFNQWYKIKESCPICRKKLFSNPSEHPEFFSIVKDLYLHHDSYFSKGY